MSLSELEEGEIPSEQIQPPPVQKKRKIQVISSSDSSSNSSKSSSSLESSQSRKSSSSSSSVQILNSQEYQKGVQKAKQKGLCRLYSQGKCKMPPGVCPYSHDLSAFPCPFYNVLGDCPNTRYCKYQHIFMTEPKDVAQLVFDHQTLIQLLRDQGKKIMPRIQNLIQKNEQHKQIVINKPHDQKQFAGRIMASNMFQQQQIQPQQIINKPQIFSQNILNNKSQINPHYHHMQLQTTQNYQQNYQNQMILQNQQQQHQPQFFPHQQYHPPHQQLNLTHQTQQTQQSYSTNLQNQQLYQNQLQINSIQTQQNILNHTYQSNFQQSYQQYNQEQISQTQIQTQFQNGNKDLYLNQNDQLMDQFSKTSEDNFSASAATSFLVKSVQDKLRPLCDQMIDKLAVIKFLKSCVEHGKIDSDEFQKIMYRESKKLPLIQIFQIIDINPYFELEKFSQEILELILKEANHNQDMKKLIGSVIPLKSKNVQVSENNQLKQKDKTKEIKDLRKRK